MATENNIREQGYEYVGPATAEAVKIDETQAIITGIAKKYNVFIGFPKNENKINIRGFNTFKNTESTCINEYGVLDPTAFINEVKKYLKEESNSVFYNENAEIVLSEKAVNKLGIEKIVIPETIDYLEENSITNCENLRTLEVQNGKQKILVTDENNNKKEESFLHTKQEYRDRIITNCDNLVDVTHLGALSNTDDGRTAREVSKQLRERYLLYRQHSKIQAVCDKYGIIHSNKFFNGKEHLCVDRVLVKSRCINDKGELDATEFVRELLKDDVLGKDYLNNNRIVLAKGAIRDLDNVEKITISDGFAQVQDNAIKNCKNLKEIEVLGGNQLTENKSTLLNRNNFHSIVENCPELNNVTVEPYPEMVDRQRIRIKNAAKDISADLKDEIKHREELRINEIDNGIKTFIKENEIVQQRVAEVGDNYNVKLTYNPKTEEYKRGYYSSLKEILENESVSDNVKNLAKDSIDNLLKLSAVADSATNDISSAAPWHIKERREVRQNNKYNNLEETQFKAQENLLNFLKTDRIKPEDYQLLVDFYNRSEYIFSDKDQSSTDIREAYDDRISGYLISFNSKENISEAEYAQFINLIKDANSGKAYAEELTAENAEKPADEATNETPTYEETTKSPTPTPNGGSSGTRGHEYINIPPYSEGEGLFETPSGVEKARYSIIKDNIYNAFFNSARIANYLTEKFGVKNIEEINPNELSGDDLDLFDNHQIHNAKSINFQTELSQCHYRELTKSINFEDQQDKAVTIYNEIENILKTKDDSGKTLFDLVYASSNGESMPEKIEDLAIKGNITPDQYSALKFGVELFNVNATNDSKLELKDEFLKEENGQKVSDKEKLAKKVLELSYKQEADKLANKDRVELVTAALETAKQNPLTVEEAQELRDGEQPAQQPERKEVKMVSFSTSYSSAKGALEALKRLAAIYDGISTNLTINAQPAASLDEMRTDDLASGAEQQTLTNEEQPAPVTEEQLNPVDEGKSEEKNAEEEKEEPKIEEKEEEKIGDSNGRGNGNSKVGISGTGLTKDAADIAEDLSYAVTYSRAKRYSQTLEAEIGIIERGIFQAKNENNAEKLAELQQQLESKQNEFTEAKDFEKVSYDSVYAEDRKAARKKILEDKTIATGREPLKDEKGEVVKDSKGITVMGDVNLGTNIKRAVMDPYTITEDNACIALGKIIADNNIDIYTHADGPLKSRGELVDLLNNVIICGKPGGEILEAIIKGGAEFENNPALIHLQQSTKNFYVQETVNKDGNIYSNTNNVAPTPAPVVTNDNGMGR